MTGGGLAIFALSVLVAFSFGHDHVHETDTASEVDEVPMPDSLSLPSSADHDHDRMTIYGSNGPGYGNIYFIGQMPLGEPSHPTASNDVDDGSQSQPRNPIGFGYNGHLLIQNYPGQQIHTLLPVGLPPPPFPPVYPSEPGPEHPHDGNQMTTIRSGADDSPETSAPTTTSELTTSRTTTIATTTTTTTTTTMTTYPATGSTSRPRSSCGGTLSSSSGYVRSPGYPSSYGNNLDCVWIVSSLFGYVQLRFTHMSIWRTSNCDDDYVEIRDGSSSSSPLVGRYCGYSLPATFTSSGSSLWIKFHSDSRYTVTGFSARYQNVYSRPATIVTTTTTTPTSTRAPCGGRFSSTSGVITSPNYPSNYNNNDNCIYVITVPSGYVQLTFNRMSIYSSSSCYKDYVEVRDGGYSNSRMVGKYCGYSTPTTIVSSTNRLYVKFRSDYLFTRTGFSATFQRVFTPRTTTATTTSTMTTYTSSCGGSLYSGTGTIRSPNFPFRYGNYEYCIWRITVRSGRRVRLSFTSFDTERCSSCGCDYVEIRDGSSSFSPIIGKYCGNGTSTRITSTGNQLYVKFRSDGSLTRTGFSASYTTYDPVFDILIAMSDTTTTSTEGSRLLIGGGGGGGGGCGGYLTSSQGNFQSPNHPQNYGHNLNCTWVIDVSYGRISLWFPFNSTFRLEGSSTCRFDYVEIRDGGLSSSPLLGKYCGSNRPRAITSSGSKLFILFRSDRSVSYSGFSANYRRADPFSRSLAPDVLLLPDPDVADSSSEREALSCVDPETFPYCPQNGASPSRCVNGACVCDDVRYDSYTCLPRLDGCHLTRGPAADSPTSPDVPSDQDVFSCHDADSTSSVVVLSVSKKTGTQRNVQVSPFQTTFSDNTLEVDVERSSLGDGDGNRAISFALVSEWPVNWKLILQSEDIEVANVLLMDRYGGNDSAVEVHNSNGDIATPNVKRALGYGHGEDTDRRDTFAVLEKVKQELGAIESFSGTEEAARWVVKT